MTDLKEHGDGERDDDLVAAEYVLGVLPAEERDTVARRVETDRAFAALVGEWEQRLSAMNAAYGENSPPDRVWRGIENRLFDAGAAATMRPGLLQSLAFWRAVSLSAIAAAFVLAFIVLTGVPQPVVGPEEIAALSAAQSDAAFLALKAPDGTVRITSTGAAAPEGRVYELWAIAGDAAPVSLGLLAPDGATKTALPADLARLPVGALTLAVTVEPPGGAPGGVATGPLVAAGKLKKI